VDNGDIEKIVLENNNLAGTLPGEIGNLLSLEKLDLEDNENISGPIPASITGLSNLDHLDLRNNQLTGNIPEDIGSLVNLKYLYLGHNQLTGTIPASIGSLTKIKYFKLRNNHLSGSIPEGMGNLGKDAPYNVYIYLQDNELSGSLPNTLGNIQRLEKFYAGHNQLTGDVPVSLVQLDHLERLSLSYNQLTGLPGFGSNPQMAAKLHISVSHNLLGFADLEANFTRPSTHLFLEFNYNNQETVLGEKRVIYFPPGNTVAMQLNSSGSQNHYQWRRDDPNDPGDFDPVDGAGDKNRLDIKNAGPGDEGLYYCRVTNAWVTGLTLESHIIKLVQIQLQYNGNIAAIKWADAHDGQEKMYVYRYDPLNRLKQAHYGERKATGLWDRKAGHYQVENISYDLNGNIMNLSRNHLGNPMDVLSYAYGQGTGRSNRLMAVSDAGDINEGFRDGNTNGDDYIYDLNGNMVTDKNKGIESIVYNHLNLPSKVDKGNGDSIVYIYDATGIKLQQKVYENSTLQKTTDYAGGFVYENDTLRFIQHEEGRIVANHTQTQTDTLTQYEYQYHLKDHLGNVRVTFTAEPGVNEYLATMESENDNEENAFFGNLDTRVSMSAANHTLGGNKASRLNNINNVGPAISLAIEKGDKISLQAWAYYEDVSGFNEVIGQAAMVTSIASAFGGVNGAVGEPQVIYDAIDGAIGLLGLGGNQGDDVPAAYLNYLVFNEDMVFEFGGFQTVSSSANFTLEELTIDDIEIEKKGFIYIYVNNESNSPNTVHFDDLKIIHEESNVVQTDSFFPFGLTFNSYQRSTAVPNKFQFQGQETQDDLGLNWVQFKWRNHDPAIGRFFNIDPLAEDYYYNSPYAFSENKVVAHVELEGLESVYIFDQANRPDDNGTQGTSYTAEIYVVQEDGAVNGPYDGSTYPNSVSNTNNSPSGNTANEGTHNFSNQFGHDGGTEQGLNLGQGSVSTQEDRNVPGTTPEGDATTMTVVNVHEGFSNNGNSDSRGSQGCVTVCPADSQEFFGNFDFSGSNGAIGTSTGTVTIFRGNGNASEQKKKELISTQQVIKDIFGN